MTSSENKTIRQIRFWAWLFIIATVLSGLTAIPLQAEINLLSGWLAGHLPAHMQLWLDRVTGALNDVSSAHPFVMYGFDWLAFGHIVIALFFYGVVKDPLRNRWLVDAAVFACLLVLPFAFVFGSIRGIPFWWQLIDCSFGLLGLLPLFIIKQKIKIIRRQSYARIKS